MEEDIAIAVALLTAGSAAVPLLISSLVSWCTHRVDDLKIDAGAVELAYEKAQVSNPDAADPTAGAKAEAKAIMAVYMHDLLSEASRIARRVGAEHPSKGHVKTASDRIGILRARAGFAADCLFAVGLLLIGVGISYQINLKTGGTAGDDTGTYVAVATAVGAALAASAAVVKWRGR